MEKITIKTKSDNEIIQECWDEGLGIILKEIDSHLVIEDPRDDIHDITIKPLVKIYHDKVELFIFKEYIIQLKDIIAPYVDNYGLHVTM